MLLVTTAIAEGRGNGDEPRTNLGALFTGLTAVGLIGGGIPLMVVGSKRKNGAIRDARARVAFGVSPQGLQISGRF